MINDEDFTVASLASLVGAELNVIDKNTESRGRQAAANKLDPRAFLSKRPLQQRNPNIVKHDGMTFHAGVDESLVQTLYPDHPPTAIPAVAAAAAPPVIQPVAVAVPPRAPALVAAPAAAAVSSLPILQELTKILASIDKTLKSIDKNEKATVKILNSLTTINSDKDSCK